MEIKHICPTVEERNDCIERLYHENKRYRYDDKERDNGYIVIEYTEDDEHIYKESHE